MALARAESTWGSEGPALGRCGRRGLDLLDELRERGRVVDGDIREDLAVDLDARRTETAHEPRVREPVRPDRRVDPRDPQSAELRLAV